MQYATQWHVLGTIGVAIVLGLAAYAIHLWVRLAGQSVTPPAAPSACQTGGRDRDHALIESIQIIATAMRTARPKALNTVSHWWCALSPCRLSMCSVTPAWLEKP